jgi:hypothetical protein
MQDEIHPIESAGGAQPVLPALHQLHEEPMLDRTAGFGHRQQDRHRLPGAGGVHVGDEAREFTQHVGRGRAGVFDHGRPLDQGAAMEIGCRGDRGEAVALDREAQEGNARAGHGVNPSLSN